MDAAIKPRLLSAPVITLPERAFTRTGSSIDPREDVWEWTDGPFYSRIDFRRYAGRFDTFIPSLKQALLTFLRRHSSGYVRNLESEFHRFLGYIWEGFEGEITPQNISNYAASLPAHTAWRLSILSMLIRRWLELHLPGIDLRCEAYLLERRIPGGKKGEPVRTRDPVIGPFSEREYTALYSAVNAAYGREELPLWVVLLTRLLFACGGRISQYASLKICDFDVVASTLKLPQAKQRVKHMRMNFLVFDISPQTSGLLVDYINGLREMGHDDQSPLFPASVLMPLGPRRKLRTEDDIFYGHCLPNNLTRSFSKELAYVAPLTERLGFDPLPITPKRFRYTFGTRMAEEGASKVLIANRLGHTDLQHVDVYFSASPKIIENIDQAMGEMLAPLSLAFQGKLVENEKHSTHKGAVGSRIIDFRVSSEPVGSCAGKGGGCAFDKPVACYTCFKFEPWLDAPHEKVLQRLLAEREGFSEDKRMAAVNDAPIQAVQEVIRLCEQVQEQRVKAKMGVAS